MHYKRRRGNHCLGSEDIYFYFLLFLIVKGIDFFFPTKISDFFFSLEKEKSDF